MRPQPGSAELLPKLSFDQGFSFPFYRQETEAEGG